jgi:hypothetical protein
MRTKRASGFRRVLFQRSTWAVSPVSRAHRRVLLLRDDRSIDSQKVRKAMALAILWRNGLPQPLARLFAPIPNSIRHHLSRLATEGNPNPEVVGFFEHKRAIRSSSSRMVEVGSSGSGVSRVVRKGGS